jgi:protein arginine N-methyltransferase 1
MYSLYGYGRMIGDRTRTGAYAEALRRTVRPGMVVVDIGTGPGILALLACRFGARRVYAIEPDDVIQVARESAAANGFQDRISFMHDVSQRVTLPEPADLVVSDLHGVLPLYQQLVPSLIDARERLLAPGGRLIPRRETLWAVLVELPEVYNDLTAPWDEVHTGLNLDPARRLVVNTWRQAAVKPAHLLSNPVAFAELDYATIDTPHLAAALALPVLRSGVAHGLALWFDSELVEELVLSNAPDAPRLIYEQAYFPWPRAVPVEPGDSAAIRLRADLVGEDYVWCWDSTVTSRGAANPAIASFRQSTFLGMSLGAASLRKRAATYRPSLKEDGEIDLQVLTLMRGSEARSNAEIAAALRRRFPHRFAADEEALARVVELAIRYGR